MSGRSWIVVLGLVVSASLAAGQAPTAPAPAAASGATAAGAVAVVDGVAVSQAELDAIVETSEAVPPGASPDQLRQARRRALGTLIDTLLLRKYLDAAKVPPVPADEVERRINDAEAALQRQAPRRSLAEFLQERNRTLYQWKEEMADQLRWDAFVDGRLTTEKLAEFYQARKSFFDGAKVRASHLAIRLPPAPAAGDETPGRREAYERARAEATARLEKLRAELLANPRADFAEYARASSDDPPVSGGDLGLIEPYTYDEAFSRAAFSLAPGQISPVVITPYGAHLIRVTERVPGSAADSARLRQAVREACSEELRRQVLAECRRAAAARIQVALP